RLGKVLEAAIALAEVDQELRAGRELVSGGELAYGVRVVAQVVERSSRFEMGLGEREGAVLLRGRGGAEDCDPHPDAKLHPSHGHAHGPSIIQHILGYLGLFSANRWRAAMMGGLSGGWRAPQVVPRSRPDEQPR